jgi:hypothetical protein
MSNENKPDEDEGYDIRIARDGTWWHNGGIIGRIGLVKLFASVLRRDEAGNYWLVTPAERGRITVEDAPFVAVEMIVSGTGLDQVLRFRTNLDEWVEAGPANELTTKASGETFVPYINVRDGLEAVLARSIYYDLMQLVTTWTDETTGETKQGVWSHGKFFPLAS